MPDLRIVPSGSVVEKKVVSASLIAYICCTDWIAMGSVAVHHHLFHRHRLPRTLVVIDLDIAGPRLQCSTLLHCVMLRKLDEMDESRKFVMIRVNDFIPRRDTAG